jgi:hypothetical protein
VNLTKTVHKYPIDRHGNVVGEVMRDFPDPVYERLEEDKDATKVSARRPGFTQPRGVCG